MSSVVSLQTNISAYSATRLLGNTTQSLRESFGRLSTGKRINSAADDAAGLAISEGLNIDERAFAQGIRNLNDALGVLRIAEGAVRELTNILIRQRELAVQSANGTLSSTQRLALDQEAFSLREEFNRIIDSTKSNNLSLLSAPTGGMQFQAGYSYVTARLADDLSRIVGDGTFQDSVALAGFSSGGSAPYSIKVMDLTGNGIDDIVELDYLGNELRVSIGNGDGTFTQIYSEAIGSPIRMAVGDVTGDGNVDIITGGFGTPLHLFTGNGDGTFNAQGAISGNVSPSEISLVDMNGNGHLDIVYGGVASNYVAVHLNNGNGTFGGPITTNFGVNLNLTQAGDVDGDGIIDIVATTTTGEVVLVRGNNDGTFQSAETLLTGLAGSTGVVLADINYDGKLDIVAGGTSEIRVLSGNGDGTFVQTQSFTAATTGTSLALVDLNGDGILDLVNAKNQMEVYLGNGDGTFQDATVNTTSANHWALAFGDINNDGVIDILQTFTGPTTLQVFYGNPTDSPYAARLNLLTKQSALESLAVIDEAMRRVSGEIGAIGAAQSTVETALNNLMISRENYAQAKARILDVDVAEESAKLLREQILQNVGVAVLGEASRLPELALDLLQF